MSPNGRGGGGLIERGEPYYKKRLPNGGLIREGGLTARWGLTEILR